MAEVRDIIKYTDNNDDTFFTTDTELDKVVRYFNNPDLIVIGLNIKETPTDEKSVSSYINKNFIKSFTRVETPFNPASDI